MIVQSFDDSWSVPVSVSCVGLEGGLATMDQRLKGKFHTRSCHNLPHLRVSSNGTETVEGEAVCQAERLTPNASPLVRRGVVEGRRIVDIGFVIEQLEQLEQGLSRQRIASFDDDSRWVALRTRKSFRHRVRSCSLQGYERSLHLQAASRPSDTRAQNLRHEHKAWIW